MATKYKIDVSMADFEYGKLYGATFDLDKSYTDGAEIATLLAIKGNGTTDRHEGKITATYQKADVATLKPAIGVVWRDSMKPVGERDSAVLAVQNYNENIYMPFGLQEEEGLVPLKEFSVIVMDDDKKYFFNTVDVALTGTVEVAGGALDTVTGTGTAFDTALAVGDLVRIGDVVREVATITNATEITVTDNFDGAIVAGATAYQGTDLFRPIYLGTDGTYVKTAPTSGLVQKVGKVTAGNRIFCDLTLDEGTII